VTEIIDTDYPFSKPLQYDLGVGDITLYMLVVIMVSHFTIKAGN
jgi:hypothetical protein